MYKNLKKILKNKYIYINKNKQFEYNIYILIIKKLKIKKITEKISDLFNRKFKEKKTVFITNYKKIKNIKKNKKLIKKIEQKSQIIFVEYLKEYENSKIGKKINKKSLYMEICKSKKILKFEKINFKTIYHFKNLKFENLLKNFKFIYKKKEENNSNFINSIIKLKTKKKNPKNFFFSNIYKKKEENNSNFINSIIKKGKYIIKNKICNSFPYINIWNFILMSYAKEYNK